MMFRSSCVSIVWYVVFLRVLFVVVIVKGAQEGEESSHHSVVKKSTLRTNKRTRQENHHIRTGDNVKNQQDHNLNVVDHDDLRYIVKYRNNVGRENTLNVANKVHHEFHEDQYIVIDFLNHDELEKLRRNEHIESIENDSIWSEQGILEETILLEDMEEYFNRSANRHLVVSSNKEQIPYGIIMTQANQINVGRNRAMVCVVDSGVNMTHPDFNPSLLSGANRITSYGNTAQWNKDMKGHGTHITGTINAIANNNYAVRGMGNIPVYITRGLDDNGNARESDIRSALEQCEASGAKVVSMSIAGGSITKMLETIIDRLYSKNIVLVAASGNNGRNSAFYPASYSKVISVGAVNGSEGIWAASNYGPWLELTAPGTGIVSLGTTSTGAPTLKVYTGTSMATPHVAASAAILLSYFPTCTATQIRFALAYTAKSKGKVGCDDYYGYGIVQVKTAYDFLVSHPCNSNTNWGKDVGDGTCSIVTVNPKP